MRHELYLPPASGGRYAISRYVEGRWIHLVQDSRLECAIDAEAIFHALGIPSTKGNLDFHFPERPGQGRCPTLALLELCNVLDPTNPLVKKQARNHGV